MPRSKAVTNCRQKQVSNSPDNVNPDVMPLELILLLLAAAAMHAVWNGMIKGAADGVIMASWVYCGAGLLLAPAMLFLPVLPLKGWGLLAGHFTLHMVYKVLLINMYRLGDFSRVFPVARGIDRKSVV